MYFEIGIQGKSYLNLNEFHSYSYTFTHSIHHRTDRCVVADGETVKDRLQAQVSVN